MHSPKQAALISLATLYTAVNQWRERHQAIVSNTNLSAPDRAEAIKQAAAEALKDRRVQPLLDGDAAPQFREKLFQISETLRRLVADAGIH